MFLEHLLSVYLQAYIHRENIRGGHEMHFIAFGLHFTRNDIETLNFSEVFMNFFYSVCLYRPIPTWRTWDTPATWSICFPVMSNLTWHTFPFKACSSAFASFSPFAKVVTKEAIDYHFHVLYINANSKSETWKEYSGFTVKKITVSNFESPSYLLLSL